MQTSISEHTFKTKWTHLMYKKNTGGTPSYRDYRRPSHCSEQSVCSNTSTSTIDKLLQAIPGLFKRRFSNASTHSDSNPSLYDEERECDRLDQLYQDALDEISYAQDSQGSRYYPGDVASAREAIDICSQACVQLLNQAHDHQSLDHLHKTITLKLSSLHSRFDALPSISSD